MPSSSTPYAKTAQVGRSRSDVSLMRDKNGCITCRVRQKKCGGVEANQTSCVDCLRLNIQCLGVTHNRPDWLRNPDALKETKYRIKHHLTEHPVPRGRGPAPERPHLDFYDLIEKYSPRIPTTEECRQYIKLDQLQPMSPESPSTNYPGGYLSVPNSHYGSPTASSPSSSYTAMPSTPTNLSDDLFAPTDMCNYSGGMITPELFYNQQGIVYHDAYVPANIAFEQSVSAISQIPTSGSPYRLNYAPPESLFLTSTSPNSQYHQYAHGHLSEHISPTAYAVRPLFVNVFY
ncbi:unnamed protein product [Rhizoctonia solani]|uniref:Zn(2)-C6 fungal-type domain-containing protein n=1 Tax=Rhizoctonia solani TaxID=456999 RepID=A0A8H2WP10_9AGAM|nr:unnamed protein product [Rhizoctonia solani]